MFELCRVASEEDEVNGTKKYERVIERVGRARQKYPSISKYYVIDYIADNPKNPKNMTGIQWHIAVHAEGGHHGSHKRTWGEGPHETVQRAEQIRR